MCECLLKWHVSFGSFISTWFQYTFQIDDPLNELVTKSHVLIIGKRNGECDFGVQSTCDKTQAGELVTVMV